MRRVYAYLLSRRGLDRDVVYTFAHRQMIYESAQYHNAVFVGFDQTASLVMPICAGTGSESTFKGNADSSIPEYSFHWTGKKQVSSTVRGADRHAVLYISCTKRRNWQQHSHAAACSVSDRVLFQMLKDNPNISEVFLCMDSDEPGQTAAKRISDKLFTQGITENPRSRTQGLERGSFISESRRMRGGRTVSGITTLIIVGAVMFSVLGGITLLAYAYSLNNIKSKTVGDGQHGTARWMTKGEQRKSINTFLLHLRNGVSKPRTVRLPHR